MAAEDCLEAGIKDPVVPQVLMAMGVALEGSMDLLVINIILILILSGSSSISTIMDVRNKDHTVILFFESLLLSHLCVHRR